MGKVSITCPLENGAPSTATDWARLGWHVWPSWVRRSRNSGPLNAMSLPCNSPDRVGVADTVTSG